MEKISVFFRRGRKSIIGCERFIVVVMENSMVLVWSRWFSIFVARKGTKDQ